MTSTPTAVPRPHPSVETAFLAPEAVLFDTRHGEIHHLNPSASAVWLLTDGESTVDRIAAELSELFGVPVDAVTGDVVAALEEFRGRGLLEGSNRADPALHEEPHEEQSVAHGEGVPDADGDVRLDIVPRPPDP